MSCVDNCDGFLYSRHCAGGMQLSVVDMKKLLCKTVWMIRSHCWPVLYLSKNTALFSLLQQT